MVKPLYAATSFCVCSPSPCTPSRIVWPAFRNIGSGLMPRPTPGGYAGAKQGTSGAETQATVQIDIARGLKLETGAGSGQGANNVGVTYEFQY